MAMSQQYPSTGSGTEHRRIRPLTIVSLAVMAILLAGIIVARILKMSKEQELPIVGPPNHTIADVTLLTQDSTPVRLSELARTHILVFDFFFTRCPSICPTLTRNMKMIEQLTPTEYPVRFVSITVDPDFDIPYRLKNYMGKYGILSNRWLFLTGNRDTIFQLVLRSFFLPLDTDASEDQPDIVHTEKFVLVDWRLRIRGYYRGIDSAELRQRLLPDIEKLYKELHRAHIAPNGQKNI